MNNDFETITEEPPRLAEQTMSPDIGKLASALAKAQAEMTGAVKDSDNPFFKSSYADLASVIAACKPLANHGLAFTQQIGSNGPEKTVTTLLMHESGQWLSSTCGVVPAKTDAQAAGSVYTYLRRYALSAIAGISQVDDDGNAGSATDEASAHAQTNMGGTMVDIPRLQSVVDEAIRMVDEDDPDVDKTAAGAKEIYQPLNNDERSWVNGKLRERKTTNPGTGREVAYWTLFKQLLVHAADAA